MALIAAFVAWELRAREPMLPMGFFRSRAFSAGNAAIFLTFASLFGAVFFYAQLLQTGLGYGPLGAGLRLMPWTATFMTVAPIAGALVDRIGERPFMVGGLTLQAAGLAWLALIAEPGMAYSQMLAPFIVGGVGVSMAIPAAQNSVLGSVAEGALGKAAGTNSMMRELGGVFGIAVVVAVFAGAGSYASAQAFIDGFAPAILVAAGLALAGAAAGLALPGRRAARVPVVHPSSGGNAMRRVMVRYKVKPERAAENEALVRAVYDELQRTAPDGLRYATFALEDGVSFVHLVDRDRGRAQPADRGGGVRALPGGHRAIAATSRRWSRSSTRSGRIASMATRAGADGPSRHPVVHLELHTGDRAGASAFYAELLRWRTERIDAGCGSATTRWGWAAPSAAGSSSARRGARSGCPTSRSSASTRSPTARGGSAPRAARAARGPGGLAQRRGDARGRRDRLLAAQGPARRLGCGMTERELLDAARRRRRGRLRPARRAPSRRCSTPTATACSARSTTPRTRCRTRCCAPGARSRASRAAARCARGCTRSPPTSA